MSAKFLLFLYFFPPAQGTAPKRNYNIAKAISARTSKSIIFTASHPKGNPPRYKDMDIENIAAFDYRLLLRRKTQDGYLPEHKKRQWWKQWGIRLINSFPINILMGEGGLLYFYSLLRKGNKAIRDHQITHLYSSFRPFVDHYAAYILKKRHPHITWIADFRDLIIDPHYHHILSPTTHQYFFKKIFHKADLLTTVSDGLARHLQAYNSNVITLRNGISHFTAIEELACKYFKIAYTGSMFLDTRNAEPLFAALLELIAEDKIELKTIRVVYAGKDSLYWNNLAGKSRLESILIDKGIVPDDEAVHIQQNACINLLLTIASEELHGVLTGKMIEYFQAGSPVLAIVVNKNDPELSDILTELEIGKSYSDQKNDLPALKEFIYAEYIHWKRTGRNRKPVNMDVLKEKYSIESTMHQFWERLGVNTLSA